MSTSQRAPRPLRLVGEHFRKRRKGRIPNCAVQSALTSTTSCCHSENVKVFNHDVLVCASEASRRLMKRVLPEIRNPSVNADNSLLGVSPS
jgi:hypothetical protein